MLRLMAMIPPRAETVKAIAERLKLSNAESARLLAWTNATLPKPGTEAGELDKLLYRGDRMAILDRLRLEVVPPA